MILRKDCYVKFTVKVVCARTACAVVHCHSEACCCWSRRISHETCMNRDASGLVNVSCELYDVII